MVPCAKIIKGRKEDVYINQVVEYRLDITKAFVNLKKTIVSFCPTFKFILPKIGTSMYKTKIISVYTFIFFTINQSTIKDSFLFSKEIFCWNSSLYIGILDVNSLFGDTPHKETMDLQSKR